MEGEREGREKGREGNREGREGREGQKEGRKGGTFSIASTSAVVKYRCALTMGSRSNLTFTMDLKGRQRRWWG
jgi:hypothetical protein